MSKWIIGDIHGCYDTFIALLEKLPDDAEIVLVGDLIDRGPKSRQVIQYVIDNKIDCVLGNHEQMMIDETERVISFIKRSGVLPRGNAGSLWTVNGGYETLKSYELLLDDVLDDRGLPTTVFDFEALEEHERFVRELPIYLEYEDVKNEDNRHLVVSHSIIHRVWKMRNKPDTSSQNMFKQCATWTRDFRVRDNPEIFNVIGHTPQEGGANIKKIYANVDTGCVFNSIGYNIMTAIEYPSLKTVTQDNIDDVTWF